VVDVSTTIVIDRPVDVVAAFAGDPDNAPIWYTNIKAVEWRTPRPLAIGSRVTFVAEFLGRRLSYTYEVRDYIPGALLRMQTAEGPFPMETTYSWSSLSTAATRMMLRNRGEPSGFGRFVAPFLALAMRRENRKDLARLKQHLEQK
jgi:uncharacterized membrane protein